MSSSSRLSLLPPRDHHDHTNEQIKSLGRPATEEQSKKVAHSTLTDHNYPSSSPTHPSTTSRHLPYSRRSQALFPSTSQNLLSSMGDLTEEGRGSEQKNGLEGENDIGVGRKLKRLSLLSKPLLSPIAPSAGPSRRSTEIFRSADTLEASFADIGSPSTPKSASAGMTRERSKGIRSSISYATSPTAALRSPARIEGGREWQRGSWIGNTSAGHKSDEQKRGGVGLCLESLNEDVCVRMESMEGELGSGLPTADRRTASATKGVTLAEKHADLLTLIAQKERKVNELKLELAQQEIALNQLKQKWTTIATRTSRPFTSQSSTSTSASTSAQSSSSSARNPTPSTKPKTSTRPRPLDHVSAASVSSSLDQALSPTSPTSSTDPYSPAHLAEDTESQAIITADVQAVFNNLLATAYGPEGVVTPSAVEGGKRFWGQLVKTVSAAAAGNAPGSSGTQADQGEAEQGQKSDSTTLKNIASLAGWSSLIPAPSSASTRPIRQPANSNRLPRQQDHRSTLGPATAVVSPTLQTSSLEASSYQDLMDLHDAPKKEDGGERKPYQQPEAEAPDEQSVKGDDGSEDEWGW